MPAYTFNCTDHGPFTAHRPIALFDAPCLCPVCETPASRQVSLPMLGQGTRQAPAPVQASATKAHAVGCGCCTPVKRQDANATAIMAAAHKPSAPTGGLFAGT